MDSTYFRPSFSPNISIGFGPFLAHPFPYSLDDDFGSTLIHAQYMFP